MSRTSDSLLSLMEQNWESGITQESGNLLTMPGWVTGFLVLHYLLESAQTHVRRIQKDQGAGPRRRGLASWEYPLEKGMATHSSLFACRIPWTEKPGGATVHAVGHD